MRGVASGVRVWLEYVCIYTPGDQDSSIYRDM